MPHSRANGDFFGGIRCRCAGFARRFRRGSRGSSGRVPAASRCRVFAFAMHRLVLEQVLAPFDRPHLPAGQPFDERLGERHDVGARPPEVPGTNTSTFLAVRRSDLDDADLVQVEVVPQVRACATLNELGVSGAGGAGIHIRLTCTAADRRRRRRARRRDTASVATEADDVQRAVPNACIRDPSSLSPSPGAFARAPPKTVTEQASACNGLREPASRLVPSSPSSASSSGVVERLARRARGRRRRTA